MDPNQVNQNPTPAVDPITGIQTPAPEPMIPTTPPVTPVEPVAPVIPEVPEPVVPSVPEPVVPVEPTPTVEEQPAAPVTPVVPQSGDMGGGQMPPTTPPAAV